MIMAYILPNLFHRTILHHHQPSHPPPPPLNLTISQQPFLLPNKNEPSSSVFSSLTLYPAAAAAAATATSSTVAPPPPPPPQDNKDNKDNRQQHNCNNHRADGNGDDDFFVNVGSAVRTLRQDLPLLFSKDLDYSIYRDDITFLDPLNTFHGIQNYKLVFWALRFHGRILFRDISFQVLRIWQPSHNLILIRWNLRGIPRVPWEAKGEFQATSRYKLDRTGKIYEHKVDNLAFNLPQPLKPPAAASVLDLVSASPCPITPTPSLLFLWEPADSVEAQSESSSSASSSSWIQFYQAVKDTLLEQQAQNCCCYFSSSGVV